MSIANLALLADAPTTRTSTSVATLSKHLHLNSYSKTFPFQKDENIAGFTDPIFLCDINISWILLILFHFVRFYLLWYSVLLTEIEDSHMDTFAELQRQSAYSSLWVNPLVAVTICEDDKRTEDEMMDLLLQMLEKADMQLKDSLATIKKQYIHGNFCGSKVIFPSGSKAIFFFVLPFMKITWFPHYCFHSTSRKNSDEFLFKLRHRYSFSKAFILTTARVYCFILTTARAYCFILTTARAYCFHGLITILTIHVKASKIYWKVNIYTLRFHHYRVQPGTFTKETLCSQQRNSQIASNSEEREKIAFIFFQEEKYSS